MANDRANAATGVGVVGSLALLATPAAPLALPALAAIIAARIFRKSKDDEIERQEKDKIRTRNTNMSTFPIDRFRGGSDFVPLHSFPLITTSPETEIARINPHLAARVLMQKSLDQSLTSLANSSVATEFARQGRGTYAAARRRKHFFGGESTEFIIRPVD